MQEYVAEFREVRVDSFFHLNGNVFIKHSTRTGKMLKNGRIFYIKLKTPVVKNRRI